MKKLIGYPTVGLWAGSLVLCACAITTRGETAPQAGQPATDLDIRQVVPFPSLLPGGQQPSQQDPIGPIAEQMGSVVGDLTDLKTDLPVQTKQHQVIGSLDLVIKELEQQCSGNGGGNPNPTKPISRSVIAKGPGGSGPLHDAQAGTRVWGQLPAKEREQILQSQTEGFPPGYESVLASYFTRLAQEQVANESAGAIGPTTQPSHP